MARGSRGWAFAFLLACVLLAPGPACAQTERILDLLKAPTRTGRAVLDKVEGFKVFLGAVDGDRMNRAMPPNKTPEVFEKLLPYALSLDLEQAWAQQFAGVLGGATQAPGSGSGYSPA